MSAVEQLTMRTSEAEDGVRIVWLVGELDMATCDQAVMIFETMRRQVGAGGLAIDLSELRFIDASGVSALVRVHNWADAAGVRHWLRGAQGVVARVLSLCGLTDIVETITQESGPAMVNRPGTDR